MVNATEQHGYYGQHAERQEKTGPFAHDSLVQREIYLFPFQLDIGDRRTVRTPMENRYQSDCFYISREKHMYFRDATERVDFTLPALDSFRINRM